MVDEEEPALTATLRFLQLGHAPNLLMTDAFRRCSAVRGPCRRLVELGRRGEVTSMPFVAEYLGWEEG